MNRYRTHNCGELTIKDVGKEVRLAGWVQKIRNLGGMEFIDLRDQFGITQIIISNDENLQKQIKDITTETSISVSGKVVERASKNSNLSTGEIEIEASNIEILGNFISSSPLNQRYYTMNRQKSQIDVDRLGPFLDELRDFESRLRIKVVLLLLIMEFWYC